MATLFRVTKMIDGDKRFWNGSESPYQYGYMCWTNEEDAYTMTDLTLLQKKVNKKKRQLNNRYPPAPPTDIPPWLQNVIDTFKDAHIEVVETTVVGGVPLNESV